MDFLDARHDVSNHLFSGIDGEMMEGIEEENQWERQGRERESRGPRAQPQRSWQIQRQAQLGVPEQPRRFVRPDISYLPPEHQAEMEEVFRRIEERENDLNWQLPQADRRAESLRRNDERLHIEAEEDPIVFQARRRDMEIKCRKQNLDRLAKEKGIVDLVSQALQDPSIFLENQLARGCLLGRVPYAYDELEFLYKVIGEEMPKENKAIYGNSLRRSICEAPYKFLKSPEACKLIICDLRLPDDGRIDGIQAMYEEQLRLEADNARLEIAREAVRDVTEKTLRHYGRKFLQEYEAAAARGEEPPNPKAIWETVKPRERAKWVDELLDARRKYGYSVYKSEEATQRAQALERWMGIFNDTDRTDNFAGYQSGIYHEIKGASQLGWLTRVDWVDATLSENDPSSLRRYAFFSHPIEKVLCSYPPDADY